MHLSLFKRKKQKDSNLLKFFPKPTTSKIIKLKNKTPTFVVDEKHFLNNLNKIKSNLNNLKNPYQIAYSFKTNYQVLNERLLNKNNVYAEVVSDYEYEVAKKNGFTSSQIIINGPYKPKKLLLKALEAGVLINIDNLTEIENISDIISTIRKKNVKANNVKANFGIRLNFNNTLELKSRFGFEADFQNLIEPVKKIATLGKLVSVHFHLGTDVYEPQLYCQALEQIEKLMSKQILPSSIEVINIGGGFPGHGLPPLGSKKTLKIEFSDFIKKIKPILEKITSNKNICLFLEPGRLLVEDSIYFVTKVIDVKGNSVVVDATANMLPLIWYRPQIVKVFRNGNDKVSKTEQRVRILGSSCQESDVIYEGKLPKTKTGDMLVFFATGSYNSNLSPNFIFEKPGLVIV